MPIKPGIYPELSNKKYHADPALGSSMMARVGKSGEHFKYFQDNPQKSTPTFELGDQYHGYALLNNLVGISDKNMEVVTGMVDALKNHPMASTLLSGGEPEVSYFWKHPKYGFMCKCRLDYLRIDIHIDLKSTVDASPEGFAKSIANFGYHKQSAHYRTGVAACHVSVDDTVLIAQEKKPPYAIGVYRLSEEDLYLGYEQNKLIYQKYEECLSTDKWPGYSPNIENISLPYWYVKNAKI